MRRDDKALDFYEKGLRIRQHLAAVNPKNDQAQRILSYSFDRLAGMKLQLRQPAASLGLYQKSFEIRDRLAKADPKNAEAQRDLSLSYDGLGEVMLQLGRRKRHAQISKRVCESVCFWQRLIRATPKPDVISESATDS